MRTNCCSAGTGEITDLLHSAQANDESPVDAVVGLVYAELKEIAERSVRASRGNGTLVPTALVNEAYLRLIRQKVAWQDRKHLFAVAAILMRRIIGDHARRRIAAKRGSGLPNLELLEDLVASDQTADEVIEVDEALRRLAEIDPGKARLVELRYFFGFSLEETAELLGCSRTTVIRQWRIAKAWLRREIAKNPS